MICNTVKIIRHHVECHKLMLECESCKCVMILVNLTNLLVCCYPGIRNKSVSTDASMPFGYHDVSLL